MSSPRPRSSQNLPTGQVPPPQWVLYQGANGDQGTDLYVKAWEPGDGLTCSHATKGNKFSCGVPVAVTREIQRKARLIGSATPRPWWEDNHRGFVVCADHLAVHFSGSSVGELNAAAERSAREQVIAKHWDEYLAALDERREGLRNKALDSLPRDIAAAIRGEESA